MPEMLVDMVEVLEESWRRKLEIEKPAGESDIRKE
jgi:hypothetical protein